MSLCASSLAFFQSLRHNATVGTEEVTLNISTLGVYPMRTSKGICFVVSFFHEL